MEFSNFIFFICLALCFLANTSHAACPKNVKPHRNFKLGRQFGKWNSYAYSPFTFLKAGADCLSTEYKQRANGRKGNNVFLDVINYKNGQQSKKSGYYQLQNPGHVWTGKTDAKARQSSTQQTFIYQSENIAYVWGCLSFIGMDDQPVLNILAREGTRLTPRQARNHVKQATILLSGMGYTGRVGLQKSMYYPKQRNC